MDAQTTHVDHPTCRLLSVSGQHWNDKPGQRTTADVEKAVEDFMDCTRYTGRLCIENPVGIISTRWRKPDQIVQPYEFGEDASKKTCLWLQDLPLLQCTSYYPPRMVNGKPRWGNQTDSGQNKLGPTKDPEDRRAARSVTYRGIAEAMADQWGSL